MSSAEPTTITSLDYRRATQTEVSGRLAPAVVGVVFFLGYLYFQGSPSITDAHARISISCLPAIVLAIIADRVPRLSRLLLFAVNFAAILVCMVPTLIARVQPNGWTMGQFVLVAAIAGAAVAAITTLTQMLQQRDGTVLTTLVAIGMTLATAALLLFASIASMPPYTLTLIIGLIAVLIAAAFHHPLRSSRGVYTITMAILSTQLASGYLWGDGMALRAGAAVVGSPLYAWVVRIPFIARRRPWQRVTIGLIIAALPALAACAGMASDYSRGWYSDGSDARTETVTPGSYGSWSPSK